MDRKTAKSWADIAAATYQWIEIPAYSRNAIKRIAGKPKGYLSDTGLACYLQRISSPDGVAAHPLAGGRADLLHHMQQWEMESPQQIKHTFKRFSIPRAAHEYWEAMAIHPGIGYDIFN